MPDDKMQKEQNKLGDIPESKDITVDSTVQETQKLPLRDWQAVFERARPAKSAAKVPAEPKETQEPAGHTKDEPESKEEKLAEKAPGEKINIVPGKETIEIPAQEEAKTAEKAEKDEKTGDKAGRKKARPAARKAPSSAARRRMPKADPEVIRQRKEERARSSRRRTRQIIGFALSILIVVGAVSIVSWGVDTVVRLLDSDEEREEYQRLFEPMVWFDILPFESVSMVDENSIKEICIWGVLNEKQDLLERNEYGEPLVPVMEIEQYAARIFGPDFRFAVYETFSTPVEGLSYTFNEDAQNFTAPVTGLMPRYLASAVEIKREAGGVRRVVMGYVSTRTGDDQVVAAPDYEHPAKYMDYLLRRDGGSYYLYAIQNNTTHVPEAASAPAESASLLAAALPADSFPPAGSPPSSAPTALSGDADSAGEGEAPSEAQSAA